MLKSIRKASFDVRKALGRDQKDHDLEVISAYSTAVDRFRKQGLALVKGLADFVRVVEASNDAMVAAYPAIEVLAPAVEHVATLRPSVLATPPQMEALRELLDTRCNEVTTTLRATRDLVNQRNLMHSELEHYHTKLKKLEGSLKDKDLDRMARNQVKADEMERALAVQRQEVDAAMAELESRVAGSLNQLVTTLMQLQVNVFQPLHDTCAASVAMVEDSGVLEVAAPDARVLTAPADAVASASGDAGSPAAATPPPPVPRRRHSAAARHVERHPPPACPTDASTTAAAGGGAGSDVPPLVHQATAPSGLGAPPSLPTPPPAIPARRRGDRSASSPPYPAPTPTSTPTSTSTSTAAPSSRNPLSRGVVTADGGGAGAGAGAGVDADGSMPAVPPPPPLPPSATASSPPPIRHRSYAASPLVARTGSRASFGGQPSPTNRSPRSASGGSLPPPPLSATRVKR